MKIEYKYIGFDFDESGKKSYAYQYTLESTGELVISGKIHLQEQEVITNKKIIEAAKIRFNDIINKRDSRIKVLEIICIYTDRYECVVEWKCEKVNAFLYRKENCSISVRKGCDVQVIFHNAIGGHNKYYQFEMI